MKRLILKVIEQILYRMSEHTTKEVKSSRRNYLVAKSALAVGELREGFVSGFKAHKELVKEKLFTVEDMIDYTKWLQENASRNNVGKWVSFDNNFYDKTNEEIFNKWYTSKI